jgi:hypothetical protein
MEAFWWGCNLISEKKFFLQRKIKIRFLRETLMVGKVWGGGSC